MANIENKDSIDLTRSYATDNGVVGSGEQLGGNNTSAETTATTATTVQNAEVAPKPPFGVGSNMVIILMYVAILGGMYFFLWRPQKKREKETRVFQAGIKAGDEVVTTSGFYGKVASLGTNCVFIEFGTNKGVIIPVSRKDVIGNVVPKVNEVADIEVKKK